MAGVPLAGVPLADPAAAVPPLVFVSFCVSFFVSTPPVSSSLPVAPVAAASLWPLTLSAAPAAVVAFVAWFARNSRRALVEDHNARPRGSAISTTSRLVEVRLDSSKRMSFISILNVECSIFSPRSHCASSLNSVCDSDGPSLSLKKITPRSLFTSD